MNDTDSLSLEGNALIHFFNDDELIINREKKAPAKEEPELSTHLENHAPIIFEGANRNGLLMVFDHSGKNSIQESDLPLLQRLVENKNALNKSLKEACAINISNQEIQWADILSQLHPKQVICWETLPAGIRELEKNKAQLVDGVMVILTDSVETLEKNPALKVPLWNELKSNFI